MSSEVPSPEKYQRERAELERVLASKLFGRARTLSRMLAYICEQCFQGDPDNIKEYNIAVEALGRPASFDPGTDTIVRVQASRLRRRLHQYYSNDGASHALHILLPESGYLPQFIQHPENEVHEEAALAEQALAEPAAAPPPRKSWRAASRILPGAGGLLLLALAVVFYPVHKTANVPPPAAPGKTADVQPATPEGEIRILAGFPGPRFIDGAGRIWLSDRYFTGGNAVTRTFRRIYRTRTQDLYRTARVGDFHYDIPLPPGIYELHLHFAEVVPEEADLDSGAEQTSRFQVSLNGKRILSLFDVVTDAGGPNTADERVFTDVTPASDGHLHLDFTSSFNKAHISGIEVIRGTPGKMLPVRLVASANPVYDQQGEIWSADRYSLGGRITHRGTPVDGTPDSSLYSSERWGHFTYMIPVADGKYQVTLRFADTYPSPLRAGQRIFDVYCNGTTLLRNFDVFHEAGAANRAVDKVFHSIPANAQGKLMISFVPVRNYAIVNAIEVSPEE